MKTMKATGVFGAALVITALFGAEAAAQAPVLTVTANGNSVTIEWTAVPGATGHTIQAGTASGLANIASVNLPASITRIVVTAPSGRYFLRVRGFVGTVNGPFSNEVDITVGGPPPPPAPPPGPCQQPDAPAASANVTGGMGVTISWNQVPGATAYRVELARSPGNTEYQQTLAANQTSFQVTIGFAGTFYARVVAGNSCGSTTSREVSFTIEGARPGSGPRTPNPPPGQLLPMPSYAESVVLEVARQFPGDLANACNSRTWLFRVLQALRQRDSRFGLNYKRGHRGSLSTDIITYNPTDRPDNGEPQVYLSDVIGSICEGNYPGWNWQGPTETTWAAGRSGDPACGTSHCAMWTIDPYLAAGFPADGREQH